MMRENLQSLLNNVNIILQKEKVKKEESRKRGERFNIFKLLGVAHYELKHSKIIACFLDPKSFHGQGDLFLKLFLKTINDTSGLNTSKAVIYVENDIKEEGRIDIFIKDDSGNGIIIENKIYAGDQNEQLIRYEKYAKNALAKHIIYYLTLYGSDASKNSAGDVIYQRISYAEHITNWLQSCIQHSATMPAIRETLVQYLNHIKQLTNQDMDHLNKQELIELLGSEKNFETALSASGFVFSHLTEIQEKRQSEIIHSWTNQINKEFNNEKIEILKNPKEYDRRAIFVVKIEYKEKPIHAYIGWSDEKYPDSRVFCQVEYDSFDRRQDNRPKRDKAFNDLCLHFLPNENNWCRWSFFEYGYKEAFDCLKKVIDTVISGRCQNN